LEGKGKETGEHALLMPESVRRKKKKCYLFELKSDAAKVGEKEKRKGGAKGAKREKEGKGRTIKKMQQPFLSSVKR